MSAAPREQLRFHRTRSAGPWVALPVSVLRDERLSPQAKLLYALLRDYAGRDGHAFPGQDRLARDLGCTDRAIRNWLRELSDLGFVEVERRGRTKTNLYWIADTPQDSGNAGQQPTPHQAQGSHHGSERNHRSDHPSERKQRSGQERKDRSALNNQKNQTSENQTQNSSAPRSPNSPSPHACDLTRLFCRLTAANGHPAPLEGSRQWRAWSKQMHLLLHRGPPGPVPQPPTVDELTAVIHWTADDLREGSTGSWPGWAAVISTPYKLREKFAELRLHALRPRRSHHGPGEEQRHDPSLWTS